MEGFRVRGGERLQGRVRLEGAKNAVLPILAAALLPSGESVIRDCPDILDVHAMAAILETLGCRCRFADGEMRIDAGALRSHEMPEALSKQIRSSIFLLGPILARLRKAAVPYPGGCEIGLRPIDLHLKGLKALGVEIVDEGGVLRCDGGGMHAGDVHFDYPSVGATENVMMAAALLPGETTIHNAAREPEIEDLQGFLNAMGGCVRGAGTPAVTVRGVKGLRAVTYTPIPDRIAGGTFLCAGAATGGEIALENVRPRDLIPVTDQLTEMGCRIRTEGDRMILAAPRRLRAFHRLQTQPHPGFPTDMQAQMLSIACRAEGASVIVENVFENRLAHVADLRRMGADIRVSGRTAVVQGVEKLRGMPVTARDLRGGAALVLAGLAAEGETLVENAALIDRGYARMEDTLRAMGAKIERVRLTPG